MGGAGANTLLFRIKKNWLEVENVQQNKLHILNIAFTIHNYRDVDFKQQQKYSFQSIVILVKIIWISV